MPVAAVLEGDAPAASLRQRSLELLLRSFSGEDGERRGQNPGRHISKANADAPPNVSELIDLCGRLTTSRESACSGAVDAAAEGILARLAAWHLTPMDLRVSALGREINRRFWLENPKADVATTSRALLANWRTTVAETKADPPLPSKWDTAWAEAMAARCAQDVEVAEWLRLQTQVQGEAESERLYRGRVRFLAAALRRPENAELRQLALKGQITGHYLAGRTEEEFLTQERRAEKRQQQYQALRSVCLREQELDLFDPEHVCTKCGKAGAKYTVVGDTGSVIVDSCSGVKRQKSRKRVIYQCASCEERWQEDDGWHC